MTSSFDRLAIVLMVALLGGDVAAQVTKTTRRTFARALELRAELLSACLAADDEMRRAAARECVALAQAEPLAPLAAAIARAQGREPDAAARFRGALIAVVVPEVVDLETFSSVHVTVQLPRLRDAAGEVELACRLIDRHGELLREAVIAGSTTVEDLLRVSATTALDVADLDDGRYRVLVETRLDGVGPAPGEPSFTAELTVLRGYGARALAQPFYLSPFHPNASAQAAAAQELVAALEQELTTPAARAAYAAAYRAADRAFRGEPQLPGARAAEELAWLEEVTRRLRAGEPPYAGLAGRRVTLGLPLGGESGGGEHGLLETPLALVSVELPALDAEPRPLVLFVPGAPSWDGGTSRPDTVDSEAPEWLVDRLGRAGFDRDGALWTAVLESPGRIRAPVPAIRDVVRQLERMLPVDGVWLVGEREGAYCVARAVCRDPDMARGAVLVAGGTLSDAELDATADVPMLLVAAHDHVATRFLESVAERAAPRRSNVELLEGTEARPWPVALGLVAREIEAFVTRAR